MNNSITKDQMLAYITSHQQLKQEGAVYSIKKQDDKELVIEGNYYEDPHNEGYVDEFIVNLETGNVSWQIIEPKDSINQPCPMTWQEFVEQFDSFI